MKEKINFDTLFEISESSALDDDKKIKKNGIFDEEIFGPVNEWICVENKVYDDEFFIPEKIVGNMAKVDLKNKFLNTSQQIDAIGALAKELNVDRTVINLILSTKMVVVSNKGKTDYELGQIITVFDRRRAQEAYGDDALETLEMYEAFDFLLPKESPSRKFFTTQIPILPPVFRPMKVKNGVRYYAKLNEIYRKLILRKNRYIFMSSQPDLPKLVLSVEQKLLQSVISELFEHIDALIERAEDEKIKQYLLACVNYTD